MLCCLNPDCPSPINPDAHQYCQSCSAPLTLLLRGHYRVTKVLSDEGGFGRTYLAEDVDKLNERCVVKQLAPKVQGTWALNKAIELFKEEAKRLQELGRHSQIPTLLAYFEQDNYLYLVQEFIEGQNLFKELQQRAQFNEAQIRELFMYVLPVLSFIHEHGVIHRDIKPQNIMRRALQYSTFRSTSSTPTSGIHKRGGDIVLIDFGASKQLTATVQTKPGTTIGSFGYSPIEQINGGEAYPASDLFSLGATCFHLLTGVSPFQLWTEYGYSWVNSWRHHLRYSVSDELGEVLDKLLKKDINQRYQSAEEVQRDLEDATTTTPSGQIPLPSLSTQRRFSSQTSSKPSPLAQLLDKFAFIRSASLANTKRTKSLLISSAVLLVSLTGTQIYGYMRYKIFPTAPTFLINSLPSSVFLQQTISAHSGYVMSVAISQDRRTLASGSTDKTIKLWSIDGEEIRVLKGHNQSVMKIAFSPDGKTLASGSNDRTAKLWNIETGQEIRTFVGHSDSISDLAFSPDKKTLATSSADKTIKLWNIATGEEIRTLRGHTSRVTSVAFSPDGKVIAAGSNDKTIKLWNISTGEEFRTLKGHNDTVTQIAFSPDGNQIASAGADKIIRLWNVSNGQEYRMLRGHTDTIWSVAFSFDSTTLASASSDTTIKLWNPFTGEEIRILQGHNSRVWSIAFSTDGKTLVSGSEDGTIKIWRVTP
ncbi:protein kinase [Calothrix sp. NIES-4071]|nr:protein kinase [Calothrix sp. NIES-4071]BAZ55961.1 protein kinase [Calothrix sp. NIES-4105]